MRPTKEDSPDRRSVIEPPPVVVLTARRLSPIDAGAEQSQRIPTGLPNHRGRARPEFAEASRLHADARRALPGPARALARILRRVLRAARGRRLLGGASTYESQEDQS